MVFSILKSLRSLFWVIVVLLITFYLFGVLFTAAVTSHLEEPDNWSDERTKLLIKYFGTLEDSTLSLFMVMSGGQDWCVFYEVFMVLPRHIRASFLLYISFSLFAVVNIVTGVFLENAMESRNDDGELIVQEELESKKRYLEYMLDLFHEMDDDASGSLSEEEFTARLNDERVLAYLNAMKLDVNDAGLLFQLIDTDNSGEVDLEKFLVGCYKLQGQARSLDTKMMQLEVRKIQDLVSSMHRVLVPTN